jgi:hypothetical protein
LVGGWLVFKLMTEGSEHMLVVEEHEEDLHESMAEVAERVKTDPPSPKVTEKSTEFADLLSQEHQPKENPGTQ